MAKKEQRLFQLIHSLQPTEKKQVRQALQRFHPQQQNKQLLLFDCYNQMARLKPELVPEAYQRAGYNANYLAADRHQLFEKILTVLRDYKVQESAPVAAMEGLQKALILFSKKLFPTCLKQIQRSEKHAFEIEAWGTLQELLDLKQRVLRVLGKFEEIKTVFAEQQQVIQRQGLVQQLAFLHSQSVQLRVAYAKARSTKQLEAMESLLKELEAVSISFEDDFYPHFHRLEILCNYYYVKHDGENELWGNQELIKLMEKHRWYILDQPLNYVAIKTRLLALQRRMQPDMFQYALDNYRQLDQGISKQQKEVKSSIFIYSHNYEIDQALKEKRWKDAKMLIPKMQKGLVQYKDLIDPHLQLSAYYRMAYALFFSRDFSKALDYLLIILNDYPAEIRPDVYHGSLLFQLLTHYELKNYKLIPYQVEQVRYYIQKKQLLFKTEQLLLKSLPQLAKSIDKDQIQKQFEVLQVTFQKLYQDPFERRLFEVFNFLDWVEMHLMID